MKKSNYSILIYVAQLFIESSILNAAQIYSKSSLKLKYKANILKFDKLHLQSSIVPKISFNNESGDTSAVMHDC